mgnify:FL=1|jgi:hypothetical protein
MADIDSKKRFIRTLERMDKILTKYQEDQVLRDEEYHGIEFDIEDAKTILNDIRESLDDFQNYDLG